MNEAPETEIELPANLKFLRVLVTILTATMIAGLVVVIVLLVTRFPDKETLSGTNSSILPSEITLPEGVVARAFTQGSDWYAIVTDQDQILIYDRDKQTLRQTITLQNN
ncbi:DUF6476 family protein [Falsihalocynthiibacter sp. S25ZX9]|uniref:DUF6476 family protein n=1 Tax=Falsihalocynthiibacter sp. S25ZX9 TaxID=3240870 RepID=UPI003510CDD3